MGDPKKTVNKYSGPRHPWEAPRLEEERVIKIEYGLKNKKDIWRQASYVKKIKDQVKKINSGHGVGIEQERDGLVRKLVKYNLLKEGEAIDAALELTTRDIMERRLQTQLVRSGLARTMKQARQFIIHGHVMVAGQKITSPCYLVSRDEQFKIEFLAKSTLADPAHPERKTPENAPVVEEAKKVEEVAEGTESVADDVAKEIFADVEEDAE